jgi:hypothetical protein
MSSRKGSILPETLPLLLLVIMQVVQVAAAVCQMPAVLLALRFSLVVLRGLASPGKAQSSSSSSRRREVLKLVQAAFIASAAVLFLGFVLMSTHSCSYQV